MVAVESRVQVPSQEVYFAVRRAVLSAGTSSPAFPSLGNFRRKITGESFATRVVFCEAAYRVALFGKVPFSKAPVCFMVSFDWCVSYDLFGHFTALHRNLSVAQQHLSIRRVCGNRKQVSCNRQGRISKYQYSCSKWKPRLSPLGRFVLFWLFDSSLTQPSRRSPFPS